MRIKKKLLGLTLCFIACQPALISLDNGHFYRAPNFYGIQNRDVSDWFGRFDANYAYGSTRSGYDLNGHKTPLLNIHGNSYLLYLATGVPKLPSSSTYTTLLTNLLNQSQTNPTTGPTFGKLEFKGRFRTHEVNLDYRQNLVKGFFAEAHLPIRNVKISNISYVDKSPTTGPFTQSTPQWIQVKNNINTILNSYGIKNYGDSYDKTSVGDFSLLAGWQHTDTEEPEFLKYYSVALRLGILFPSGKKDDTSYAFSVPTGYNQHWGIPARFDLIVGPTDWLQIGGHAGVSFFFDKTYNRRMKTNSNQSGFIILGEGNAKVDKGTLWDLGTYVKFEKFIKGLSGFVGYSYSRNEHDELTAQNTSLFSDDVVNGDSKYQDWDMHTINLMLEYDFSTHMNDESFAPRINLHYNIPVAGKRVFTTDMFGGGFGLDIKWNF